MEQKQIKNKNQKQQKGFYTALAISVIMVLGACAYSYSQTEKSDDLTAENTIETEEVNANRTQSDVPKVISTESESDETEISEEITSEEIVETNSDVQAMKSHESEEETEEKILEFETEELTSHILRYPIDTEDLAEEVLEPFSNGELIKFETTGCWQTHNGTDFKATKGDDIYACDGGVVVSVLEDGLWGITVEIDHENGIISRYCGLGNELVVAENDRVASGQKIGVLSDNPEIESDSESHFHFEVLENGKYIDAVEYLVSE